MAELLNKAYSWASSKEKATKTFKMTGIRPFNPNVYIKDNFLAANRLCKNLKRKYLRYGDNIGTTRRK